MDATDREQTWQGPELYRRRLDANRRLLDRLGAACASSHELLASAYRALAVGREYLAEIEERRRRQ